MSQWRNLTNTLIQRLKRDPTYQLDPNLSLRAMWAIFAYRGPAYLRGKWYQLSLHRCGGNLFAGSHLSLRSRHLISVGRSVILEDYVAIDALSQRGVQLGDNVTIARGVTIQCTGVIRNLGVGLEIGNNSAVGAFSFLGAQGGITIGNNVIIGPKAKFHSENHQFESREQPIRLQGETRKGIVVQDDCWIGSASILVDGVTIGEGSVVGAGSVVTKSVPPYSVIAGVPARIIKTR